MGVGSDASRGPIGVGADASRGPIGVGADAIGGSGRETAPAEFRPPEKMTFSCFADPGFLESLQGLNRRQVLLAGIESHVCVFQTACDLVGSGYEVFVAADAVSSRSARNVEIALRRMEQEGVRLTSVEMAVFEMLHACGTPEFKAWSQVIR